MTARAVDGGAMLHRQMRDKIAAEIRSHKEEIANDRLAQKIIEQHVLPYMPATLRTYYQLHYYYVSKYALVSWCDISLMFKALAEETGDLELGTVIKVRDALLREGWSIPNPDPNVSTSDDKLTLLISASKVLPRRRSFVEVLRRRPKKIGRVSLTLSFSGLNETDRCHIETKEVYEPGHMIETSVVVCDE